MGSGIEEQKTILVNIISTVQDPEHPDAGEPNPDPNPKQ
jgi:hypothetical protein